MKNRSLSLSIAIHAFIALIILVFSYSNVKIFNLGNAVSSPQQVQIVNATLVLPKPSLSHLISPTPPAPAPPTPPVKDPTQQPHPHPTKPSPQNAKPVPQKLATSPEGTLRQKDQKPSPQASQSSVARQEALQKLKALGLSSLQQASNSNQKEAASAAQAAKDLSIEQQYMGLIQQTIRSNWINQFPQATLTTTLHILLDRKGNVLSVSISQSSGNASFDRQAVLAVKKSSPLPLPPDSGLAKKFMNITLPFSNQLS